MVSVHWCAMGFGVYVVSPQEKFSHKTAGAVSFPALSATVCIKLETQFQITVILSKGLGTDCAGNHRCS